MSDPADYTPHLTPVEIQAVSTVISFMTAGEADGVSAAADDFTPAIDGTAAANNLMAMVADVAPLLARLARMLDDHFELGPGHVTWADVAQARVVISHIREAHDLAFHEGKYAPAQTNLIGAGVRVPSGMLGEVVRTAAPVPPSEGRVTEGKDNGA